MKPPKKLKFKDYGEDKTFAGVIVGKTELMLDKTSAREIVKRYNAYDDLMDYFNMTNEGVAKSLQEIET